MRQGCLIRPEEERPTLCLSTQLLGTYKSANQAYYAQQRQQHAKVMQRRSNGATLVANGGFDDEHGNYIVQLGEELHGRFLVKELLGKGSFGVVVKAYDQRREDLVAVKIIRNRTPFATQAQSEISILTELNDSASEEDHIVRLRKYFQWHSHLCLVFELLSMNLYDLIKATKFTGVSLGLCRKFGFQLGKALNALRRRNVPIIHGDLKPENILLKNSNRSWIKVVDFGSSCYCNQTIYQYIQSRYYRSPEVILGLPYDCGIDCWSLACVLVELYLGHPLFAGRSELDQLHKFRTILGDIPQSMISTAPKRAEFYNEVELGPASSSAGAGAATNGSPAAPTKIYVLKPLAHDSSLEHSSPRRSRASTGGGKQSAASVSKEVVDDTPGAISPQLLVGGAEARPLPTNWSSGAQNGSASSAASVAQQNAASVATAHQHHQQQQILLSQIPHGDDSVRSRLMELLTRGKSSNQPEQKTSNMAAEVLSFVDLLTGMLRYQTVRRMVPSQWLSHPWMQGGGTPALTQSHRDPTAVLTSNTNANLPSTTGGPVSGRLSTSPNVPLTHGNASGVSGRISGGGNVPNTEQNIKFE